VPTNVQFVLEGVLKEQERVTALIGNPELALLGKGEAIPVAVEKGWVSTMNRVAVRLKPKKPLEPNTEYTLTLGRVMPKVTLLNDAFGDNTPRWRTGAAADTTPPRFIVRPAVSEGSYLRTKQGLTRFLKLRTQVSEVGPTYLVVAMTRARGTASKQQYLLPLDGENALLGHDACSGAFGFDDGRAYRLVTELFDAAGNRASTMPTLELSAPKPLAVDPSEERAQ